jgi:hypothetical protein
LLALEDDNSVVPGTDDLVASSRRLAQKTGAAAAPPATLFTHRMATGK